MFYRMPMYIQAYITCAIGVHYVGFMLMTLATTSGIAGYISGHLHQYIGRIVLILTRKGTKKYQSFMSFAIANYQ